jgi:hypothetical protein
MDLRNSRWYIDYIAVDLSKSCEQNSGICIYWDKYLKDVFELIVILSWISIILSYEIEGLPDQFVSTPPLVSQNLSINFRTELQWEICESGNFLTNCLITSSVYLPPLGNTYSTRNALFLIVNTIFFKQWNSKWSACVLIYHFLYWNEILNVAPCCS